MWPLSVCRLTQSRWFFPTVLCKCWRVSIRSVFWCQDRDRWPTSPGRILHISYLWPQTCWIIITLSLLILIWLIFRVSQSWSLDLWSVWVFRKLWASSSSENITPCWTWWTTTGGPNCLLVHTTYYLHIHTTHILHTTCTVPCQLIMFISDSLSAQHHWSHCISCFRRLCRLFLK